MSLKDRRRAENVCINRLVSVGSLVKAKDGRSYRVPESPEDVARRRAEDEAIVGRWTEGRQEEILDVAMQHCNRHDECLTRIYTGSGIKYEFSCPLYRKACKGFKGSVTNAASPKGLYALYTVGSIEVPEDVLVALVRLVKPKKT